MPKMVHYQNKQENVSPATVQKEELIKDINVEHDYISKLIIELMGKEVSIRRLFERMNGKTKLSELEDAYVQCATLEVLSNNLSAEITKFATNTESFISKIKNELTEEELVNEGYTETHQVPETQKTETVSMREAMKRAANTKTFAIKQ